MASLGKGLAEKARKKLKGRKKQLDKAISKGSGKKKARKK